MRSYHRYVGGRSDQGWVCALASGCEIDRGVSGRGGFDRPGWIRCGTRI